MKFRKRKRQLVPVVNVIEIFSSSDESEDESGDDEDVVNEIALIDPVIEISDDEDIPIRENEDASGAEIMSDDDRPLDQIVRPVEPCPVLNISTDSSGDEEPKSNDLDLDQVRWSSPSDSDSDSSDYGDEFVNHMIPGNFVRLINYLKLYLIVSRRDFS